MFASIRRCINCPFEWTNTHLHRQVAAHIKNKKRLGTLTQEEKDDYEVPGPFSLVTYLKALIKKKFYGDEIVLIVISMVWQVHISILNAETLRQIKIRTSNKINKFNIALAHCQYNHYIPLGKYCDLSICHHD